MKYFMCVLLALIAISIVNAENAPSQEYLPPTEDVGVAGAGIDIGAVVGAVGGPEGEPGHVLTDDGYRYRTVKKYRIRRRRY